MDKYLKKSKATISGHTIVKEELIISDDEESNEINVETVDESIDKSFLETSVSNEYNGVSKDRTERKRSRCFRNKNDKQSTLDLFFKTENFESNEQFENPKNKMNDENPKANAKPVTSDNIDTLYKKFAKAHCSKCKVKRAVIRQKARCRKCKTQLTYSCEPCNKTYGAFTDLGYHLKSQHASQVHICPECNKTFAYRNGMLAHRRIQHGYVDKSDVVEQRCTKCGKKFKSNHLRMHEKVCGKEASFKCDKCPYVAFYKSNLTTHMLEKHTGFLKKCENCDKFFTNPRSMRRHLKVYCKKVKRIECDHCGHKFYRRDQVLKHIDQAHFAGSLTGNLLEDLQASRICKYCDTTLDHYQWMRSHLGRCESAPLSFRRQRPPCDGYDRSYRNCKYCGMYLDRYDKIRYHLERCESAPPDCRPQSEMADQPDLATALKNLSKAYCEKCKTKRPMKVRQPRCKKCDASVKFICVRCPKSFNQAQRLFDHLRANHLKNKKFYQCGKCNRSYTHLKHLKVHKKNHHPSKPTIKIYNCSKCGKKYRNDASLRKHRISCVEEPKFHCDKCPYKTHFKSSLVDHFRAKKSTCI